MKQLYLLVILTVGALSQAFGQIAIADITQLQQMATYAEGKEALIREFKLNTRYAASAQRKKAFGTIVGIIKVSRSGEIVEVNSLNKALPEFVTEFERLTRALKGTWQASNDTAQFFYAIIPLQFSIPGDGYTLRIEKLPPFVHPPILISAHWSRYQQEELSDEVATANYKAKEKALENQVKSFTAQGNIEKAIEAQEELLQWQPFDANYYATMATLLAKQGKAAESHYYQQVHDLLKP